MKDKIQKLENLGFTLNESKVFLSLMSGNVMTASEIAKSAGIPRTSVYEILKTFTEKGICNEIETPTKLKYEIIDPDVVKDKIEREIKKSHSVRLDSLENTFDEFKALYKADSDEDGSHDIELLRGFNKHRQLRVEELIKNSNEQILLMNRLRAVVSKGQGEEVIKFFKRGGELKAIYEIASDFKVKVDDRWEEVTKAGLIELCEQFEKDGVQTRFAKRVPQNLMVFDKKIVFLNIVKEVKGKPEASDVIINNDSYAELMVYTFDNLWNSSMTLTEFKESLK